MFQTFAVIRINLKSPAKSFIFPKLDFTKFDLGRCSFNWPRQKSGQVRKQGADGGRIL